MDGEPVKQFDTHDDRRQPAIIRQLTDFALPPRTSATHQSIFNSVLPLCLSDAGGITVLPSEPAATKQAADKPADALAVNNAGKEFSGSIYLIGGSAKKCMDEMIKLVGPGSKIAVVGLASGTDEERLTGKEHPDEDLAESLVKRGVPTADITIIIPKNYTSVDTKFHHQYDVPDDTKLIYFGGGAQDVLRKRFDNHQLEQVEALLDKGAVVAGNSAGTAVMPREMISNGDAANLEHQPGFGLTPWLIMDTHVDARPSRIQRDVRAFYEIGKGERPVIGLDEDTSIRLFWENSRAENTPVQPTDSGAGASRPEKTLKAVVGGVGFAHVITSKNSRLKFSRTLTPSYVTSGLDKREASLIELQAGDHIEIEKH